jgi:hypothetical protein
VSRSSRRAADREREAADVLGTKRVRRGRYESKPDVEPIRHPNGDLLQPEVKTRKKLPRLITTALAQAERYSPSAVPIAVLSELGGAAVVVVALDAFVRLTGIAPSKSAQLALALRSS